MRSKSLKLTHGVYFLASEGPHVGLKMLANALSLSGGRSAEASQGHGPSRSGGGPSCLSLVAQVLLGLRHPSLCFCLPRQPPPPRVSVSTFPLWEGHLSHGIQGPHSPARAQVSSALPARPSFRGSSCSQAPGVEQGSAARRFTGPSAGPRGFRALTVHLRGLPESWSSRARSQKGLASGEDPRRHTACLPGRGDGWDFAQEQTCPK